MTTSCPHSTIRFAFSRTIPAIFTCRSAGSSNVEAMTSAFTVRAMSVTSSGRSSISNIIRYASGWFAAMAFAMSFIKIVLPVLGWATIRARCPLPIGANKSTMRVDRLVVALSPQSVYFVSGKRGVKCSNGIRSLTSEGERPLIVSMAVSGKYFSPS